MFAVGQAYPRSALLDFVGSKQMRTGIIWGPERPDCVIVTSGGRHSDAAGYEDGPDGDGSWTYFGQGQSGDQSPDRFANKLLVEGHRSVLLFTTTEPTRDEVKLTGKMAKHYRFEGVFRAKDWQYHVPKNGNRAGNKLILFRLVPQDY